MRDGEFSSSIFPRWHRLPCHTDTVSKNQQHYWEFLCKKNLWKQLFLSRRGQCRTLRKKIISKRLLINFHNDIKNLRMIINFILTFEPNALQSKQEGNATENHSFWQRLSLKLKRPRRNKANPGQQRVLRSALSIIVEQISDWNSLLVRRKAEETKKSKTFSAHKSSHAIKRSC